MQDLSVRLLSLIALFPACFGSRPAAPFPGGGRGKMKIAISWHAAQLHSEATPSLLGEDPSQGPGPAGAPTFPTPRPGETSALLSCVFAHVTRGCVCLCIPLRSEEQSWCPQFLILVSSSAHELCSLSRRGQECFLWQGRVVAHDSNFSILAWHPLLKPAASSCPGGLCHMGCVQGEGRGGTYRDNARRLTPPQGTSVCSRSSGLWAALGL